MNQTVSEWLNLLFRWLHVVSGIVWIGHLYFFNFVNAQVAKTYDADSKKKVVPELMPRALYWFRWGAAYTFLSGTMLLGLVVYMGGITTLPDTLSLNAAMTIGTGVLFGGFVVYDQLWKRLAKNETAGVVVSFLLLAGVTYGMSAVGFSGRAVFIHVGSLLGTIMAANVWMRIWPAQRKIIAAIRDGQAPDAALVAMAGLRSKQNTYMSVPLVFMMVSNHFPTVYGHDLGWVHALMFVVAGCAVTKMLFNKAAGPAPKTI